ncbi:MAG: 50S ribosomal protein L35 [Clostridia bacterium]|jgi:large subunit ribosomal protein L35|nr:50S ribosomal protein L35 [Clostridia bacterium]MBP5155502.1 50S ribosomal protein L35 [Clostridia bacterium]MBR0231935.1 50S ribosomal protein L35 [Clostridia bacterium]MBR4798934.1 50S ribosomal protein L35 [Clostridia bacterium]MBR5746291.1 50S ribosomal protein L35 [Clostridia bacterium]
MGKIKTHKASAKRFTFTGTGKLKMGHPGHRHKTGLKTSKRMRSLRKASYVSKARTADLKRMLPYD